MMPFQLTRKNARMLSILILLLAVLAVLILLLTLLLLHFPLLDL